MSLSINTLLSLLIKAAYHKCKGVRINNEVDLCPRPSQCPCMEQEYILSDGRRVHIEEGQEIDHEFELDKSPFMDCGTLSGRVKDKHGCPIENALVKVFGLDHEPITHVFTNKDGYYLLCLPAGDYWVMAVR